MSRDYSAEREITINKPKQEVFEYVKYLKNQDSYSTWNMMDPKMKHSYRGTDGTEVIGTEYEKSLANLKGILEKQ